MPHYQSMYNVPLTPLAASQSGGEAGGGGGVGTSLKHSTTCRAASKVVLSQTKKGNYNDYEVDDDDDYSDESTYSDETDADYDDDDDDDDYTDTECDGDDEEDGDEYYDDSDVDDDDDDIMTVKNKSSTVDVSKSRKSKKVVKTANTSMQVIRITATRCSSCAY